MIHPEHSGSEDALLRTMLSILPINPDVEGGVQTLICKQMYPPECLLIRCFNSINCPFACVRFVLRFRPQLDNESPVVSPSEASKSDGVLIPYDRGLSLYILKTIPWLIVGHLNADGVYSNLGIVWSAVTDIIYFHRGSLE